MILGVCLIFRFCFGEYACTVHAKYDPTPTKSNDLIIM